MAELGPSPQKSGDIAKLLGKKTSQIGPTRDGLIQNGMIYSPKYGYAAFIVPLFDEFMKRTEPRWFAPRFIKTLKTGHILQDLHIGVQRLKHRRTKRSTGLADEAHR